MVKIPTKARKSKITAPPKNVSTFKTIKKAEKPKAKCVPKPKVGAVVSNKRPDLELPCSSRQAAGAGAGAALNNGNNNGSNATVQQCTSSNSKADGKVTLSTNSMPLEQMSKDQIVAVQTTNAVALTNPTTAPTSTTAGTSTPTTTTMTLATTTTATTNPSTAANANERLAVEGDTETQTKFRSGVRYSDVLRSKNVSSNGNVKPALANALPPPTPPQLLLTPSTTHDVKDIDLTLFPELGQHRNCQTTNSGGSASLRLMQRSQRNGADDDSSPGSLEGLQHTQQIDGSELVNQNNQNDNETTTHNARNSASDQHHNHQQQQQHHQHQPNEVDQANGGGASCPQCALNSLWVQHALFNSAQPYHMDIPEFNFLRADQNYPRFLGQFEDENYLKTENLALLGLKLALGGNFHSMHSNSGR